MIVSSYCSASGVYSHSLVYNILLTDVTLKAFCFFFLLNVYSTAISSNFKFRGPHLTFRIVQCNRSLNKKFLNGAILQTQLSAWYRKVHMYLKP